jgi:GMP synthase-like glutamine amidotransferase
MILLLSTCKVKFSEEEFVKPIAKIVKDDYEVKHFSDKIDFNKYSKIIICGTALIDNDFLDHIDKFEFLKSINVPVLGICSGMQAIGLTYGASLTKQKEIGMVKVHLLEPNLLIKEDINAYGLHGNALKDLDNFNVLAMSKDLIQAFKHKEKDIYGIMFHPEVRNEQIIENFLRI